MRPTGNSGQRWIWARPVFLESVRFSEPGKHGQADEDDLMIYWSDQTSTLRRQVFGKDLFGESMQQGQWVREYQPLLGAVRVVLKAEKLAENKISGVADQIERVVRQGRDVILEIRTETETRNYSGERSAQDALASL